MQTNTEENKSNLHDQKILPPFRLNIADDFVLVIYRNLAANWWWGGLEIKARVEKDLVMPDRFNLYQTEDSHEYDPINYPLKPHKLGYLEITRVDENNPKPIDVKVVCSWTTVLSFWEELDRFLREELPVLPLTLDDQAVVEQKEEDKVIKSQKEIKLPKRFANLDRWKELYKLIKGWTGMSPRIISEKIKKDPRFKNLPVSHEAIAKVIRAGKAGLLD